MPAARDFNLISLNAWIKENPGAEFLRAAMLEVFAGAPDFWEWKGWAAVAKEAENRMLGGENWPR